jgi:chromosomal replication initiator protein
MNVEQIWLSAQPTLREHIGFNIYDIWVHRMEPKDFGEDYILFIVPNKYFGDYVEKNIWPKIAEVLLALTGTLFTYKFAENSQTESTISPEIPKEVRIIEGIPQNKIFDNFVVGACNQFAHAAALAVAESPGDNQYNPLFIYGSTGLGKTHLLYAIANQIAKTNPNIQPLYLTAEIFMNDMIENIRFKTMSSFKQKYRDNCQLLLMDDIQFLTGKPQTQEELFHTFEYLKQRGHQIVFTADVLPKEIDGLEPRLSSRCQSGMIADTQPPDLETMIAIIRQKSSDRNITLPEDVALFIAKGVRGNVREVEGAINRLQATSRLTKKNIDIIFAKQHLGELFAKENNFNIDIDAIIKTVATTFNIRSSDIRGKRRTKNLIKPRHIAMYLARTHTDFSFPEIGKEFGDKDHGSILYGYNKISEALKQDPSLRQTIELIERDLKL